MTPRCGIESNRSLIASMAKPLLGELDDTLTPRQRGRRRRNEEKLRNSERRGLRSSRAIER
jgi:hypothetical protein